MRYKVFYFLLLLILGSTRNYLMAQGSAKVEILAAQNFEFLKLQDKNVSKLIGNVKLKQQDTYLDCDSALIYETENLVEAYSNVRIKYKDSVTITGNYLLYDGNTKRAIINQSVTLQDKNMILTTEQLDYDLANQYGYYGNGANIVSKENKLTSKLGYYYARKSEFFFKKDVTLVNPDYTMTSDTLMYNTKTKTAYFYGSTKIIGAKEKIFCENGWYNTDRDQSQFSTNATLISERKILQADSLYYDRKLRLGKAFRNIHVYDSVQRIHLYGQVGYSNEKTGITQVSIRSKAIKLMEEGDSLFLYADTLYMTQRQKKQKETLRVFHDVKIFKNDLQAVCDSLVYIKDDSTIWMYRSPVMWSGQNQIFSDTICFFLNAGKLDSFYLLTNAMIISKIKGAHFDQIRGRNMKGQLDSGKIEFVRVLGNAQSIHYEKEDSVNFIGVNEIECSYMNFVFSKGEVKKAVFETAPTATMHPPDAIKPEDFRLKGFRWLDYRRPQRLNFQY
jgi:lipopolysaccharide export system protein LptA